MSADPRPCEKGFSLPEVLIAAAISAGVVAAAAQSIAYAVRLNAASARTGARLNEAAVIVARVNAGMSEREALEGFDDWRLDRSPVPPLREHEPGAFDLVALAHGDDAAWSVEFWAPKLTSEAP